MAATFGDWMNKASKHIGEEVVALVAVQPRGAAGAMGAGIGLSKISPLAGMAVSKMQGNKGNAKAGGLGKITAFQTKSAILCVTADSIYVYEAKQGFGGLKLKDPLYVWPRKDVTIRAEPQTTTAAIDIELPDGTTFEVESMMLGEGPKQLDQLLSVMGQ